MNNLASIRRSRGVVCGVALILLGLWGGIAPFVGPYFHFGYTPDKAWAYTTGRLYFSAIPGGAALLGGILVAATRNRGVGVAGGLLGALAGIWFVLGSGVTFYLLKHTSISAGSPIGTASGGPFTVRMYLEVLALYGAVGALIIFFGALACGRMSMITARDVAAAEAEGAAYYTEYPASSAASPDPVEYPTTSGTFPAATHYSGPSTGQFPTATGQVPTSADQFPSASGQFTRPSTFRRPPEEFGGPSADPSVFNPGS